MAKRVYAKRIAAIKHGYRSGLEEDLDAVLKENNIDGEYEKHKIKYTIPTTDHTYTPDFKLPNGIYIETKGRLVLADMKKHILIKQQHPHLDIRFVFQNSKAKIRKGSTTTYAMWADKHGFRWANKTIPLDWLCEII